MTDPKNTVIITALLNLVRLLATEMVAGRHRDDVGLLIHAMDAKINETPLPRGIDVNDAREGFQELRRLLRPVVRKVRAQAAAASIDDYAKKLPSYVERPQ